MLKLWKETLLKEIAHLLHFSAVESGAVERRVEELLPQREGEESAQPDASAAERLRFLPAAGSSARREVAPEETAYMTASLCSLLPSVHPCVGLLTA